MDTEAEIEAEVDEMSAKKSDNLSSGLYVVQCMVTFAVSLKCSDVDCFFCTITSMFVLCRAHRSFKRVKSGHELTPL